MYEFGLNPKRLKLIQEFWAGNRHPDSLKDFIYLFLERGRKGEREGEKLWLPLMCTPTWDQTHNPVIALTRNPTSDPSLCRRMPNPSSHTGRDRFCLKKLTPLGGGVV